MLQLHGVKELEIYKTLDSWSWGWMDDCAHANYWGHDDLMMIYPSGLGALWPVILTGEDGLGNNEVIRG
jgi:hypothetical protein